MFVYRVRFVQHQNEWVRKRCVVASSIHAHRICLGACACVGVRISVCDCALVSVCLSVGLSVCLFVCLHACVCVSIYLSINQSNCFLTENE